MKTLVTFLLVLYAHLFFAQRFTPLGNGITLNGNVNCIIKDETNDRLYVGGSFDNVEQVNVNNIAYLKDGQWYSIPNKISGIIYDIEIHQNEIYVAGSFEISGEEKIYDIARYDGQSWHGLGKEDETGSVRDMVWYNNALYVTGSLLKIGGVEHTGVSVYKGREWNDAGLQNVDKSSNLHVKGDTLWAWGQIQNSQSNAIHTASYFVNGKWESLPPLLNLDRGEISSFIKYKNKYYSSYSEGGVYVLENNRWNLKSDLEIERLFVYKEQLMCLTQYDRSHQVRNAKVLTLADDLSIVSIDQLISRYYGHEPKIEVINEIDDELYFGGDFITLGDDYYASIASYDGDKFSNIGNLRGGPYKNFFGTSLGRDICKYKDGYAISGSFYFADSLFNPNVVYWDGEKFTDAIKDLPREVYQMVSYKGELYAISFGTWADYDNAYVIKWDGNQWKSFFRRLMPDLIDNIKVIDDKIFFWNDEGLPYTWDGNQLERFDLPKLPDSPYGDPEMKDIVEWNNGIVVLSYEFVHDSKCYYRSNNSTMWELLSDQEFDTPKLSVIGNRLFISDDILRDVIGYEWIDTSWVQLDIEEDGNQAGKFYAMNNLNFYTSWNGSMRLEEDNVWLRRNPLRILDEEKLNNDKYLCTGIFDQNFYVTISHKTLNNIAIVDFSEPISSISIDRESICTNEYVTYTLKTDYSGARYNWHFPGGIPEYTSSTRPIIKYKSPGTYSASLEIEYYNGTSITYSEDLIVSDECIEESYRNHDNIWMMGYHYAPDIVAGIDFSNGDMDTVGFNTKIEMTRGSTSMSDKNGDLQFYTNGLHVMNKGHDTLYNSTNYNPSPRADYVGIDDLPLPQSVLSMPQPGQDSIYYLTHLNYTQYDETLPSLSLGWKYSVIDMSDQSGNGAMIVRGETLTTDTMMYSTMQAAPHCNGEDWWLVCAKAYSDIYYRALLTKDGISSVDSFSSGITLSEYIDGQSVFSPDGTKYCLINSRTNAVYLWDFDSCTGRLHNPMLIEYEIQDESDEVNGCAFSPNSRFLYLSSYLYYRQLDMCKINSGEDPVTYIEKWDGKYSWIYPVSFATQSLAPNNKIVVTPTAFSRFLSTVHNPDGYGKSCDFRQHDIELKELTYNFRATLPEYPHYRIQETYSNCDTTIVTNVENENLKIQLKVYPNPVNSMITFDAAPSSFGDNIVIKVYDLNGRLMHDIDVSNSPSFTLNMSTYTAGLYPYSVTQRGQVIYENKIVKID